MGTLGTAAPESGVDTTVYTVPVGKEASVTISACNRGDVPVTVRIAVSSGAVPTDAEWIEYGVSIPAHGVLGRTGLICGAGDNIVVHASTANVSVRVEGFEEAV